jgi:hypothetical protein
MKNGIIINEWNEKLYFVNDLLHRDDGPAFESGSRNSKEWYQHGLLHRLDGPAIEWYFGDKVWFFHGKSINCKSQEEFKEQIKLAMFW